MNGSTDKLNQLKRTDELVGRVLGGNYAVLDLLGQGAMAKVYKARQLNADRFVAIKTLTSHEPDMVARFMHEVKTHARLNHRNIVQAIDCLVDAATQEIYFIMEYLPGLAIEELIKKQGPVRKESDLVRIVSQICDALDHAHQQRIIHRDLKPSNVILQETEGQMLIKVVDFGLAKVQEEMQRLTKTGQVVGSPVYMSPEQCMGKELDNRSDIYSMGILIYELITGRPPYTGPGLVDVMRAHCNPSQYPTPVEELGATMRNIRQLNAILNKCLATDAMERFATIEELKEAVRSWYKSDEENRNSAGQTPSIPLAHAASLIEDVQLRDLISSRQTSLDPNRIEFSDAQLITSIQSGASKMRISNALVRMSDSLVGSVLFNRYKILDLLGEGGMSIVYRALDHTTQEVVAIKTLKFADSDLSARFARETSIHSELKHPNIVKAIECIESPGGQSFFIMEYLKGVVLQDLISAQGRINHLEDVVAIFGQVLNAIEYAHEKGVLHRDIKPENIILIEQRGQLKAKVLDFGVAKIQEDLQRLTKTGVVVGSPAYMSPEQCLGKPLSHASDLYSLAIVAYEMMTGHLPYDADSDVDIMKAHCNPDLLAKTLAAHRYDLPDVSRLDGIFQKALSKDAEKRYQSVGEFKQELDEWWRGVSGDLEIISPFKSSGRKSGRAARPKEVSAAKNKEEQASDLSRLMLEHRTAQEKSYRSKFDARVSLDIGRFIRPVAAALLVIVVLCTCWAGVSWLEANRKKGVLHEPEAANDSEFGRTESATKPEIPKDMTPSSSSAPGTRRGGVIRGPNQFNYH